MQCHTLLMLPRLYPPPPRAGKPTGKVAEAIDRDLGGYDKFVEAFKAAGEGGLLGSDAWRWWPALQAAARAACRAGPALAAAGCCGMMRDRQGPGRGVGAHHPAIARCPCARPQAPPSSAAAGPGCL